MRGDFSRLPSSIEAPRGQVLMQQGRVQLDADWNAQVLETEREIADLRRDGVGSVGTPAHDPGFAVVTLGGVHLGPDHSEISFNIEDGGANGLTVAFWLCPRNYVPARSVRISFWRLAGVCCCVSARPTARQCCAWPRISGRISSYMWPSRMMARVSFASSTVGKRRSGTTRQKQPQEKQLPRLSGSGPE